jgi:hypothetical protein
VVAATPVRSITTPARGTDGLFVQPHAVGPKREIVERHNRDRFAGHFKYGDQEVNPNTFDDRGDYNCGRCNQADGTRCLLVKIAKIDRDAGSCGDWEILCAGDPEMRLEEKSPDVAVYGVALNGKGFGCHRCPYASAAYEPDSRGRELYCGKGDFRVPGDACCSLNGAPVVSASKAERRYQTEAA